MNFLLILFTIFFTTTASPWDNRTVTIAVVEYQPIRDPKLSPEARIAANSANYIKFLHSFNHTNLDMLIFPEATLANDPRTAVDVQIGDNPCDSPDSSALMRQLSCAARSATSYLVVNLVEKEKCQQESSSSRNCQKYGFFYYNTDAIFDRNGAIVSRYRKYNLFLENELDKPSVAEEVVIETDFGVKYGIFTCFDILFKSPAQDLLGKGVDGVIFPTMWFSELPFFTALQTQQMWAHTHDVKVFSAGANHPVAGSGGSGIYSGAEGMILGGVDAAGGSQLYVYKYVTGQAPSGYNPQEPMPYQDPDVLAKQMDNFHLLTDSSIKKFNSTVLDTSRDDFNGTLCYDNGTENKLCCAFAIKTSADAAQSGKEYYVYHLVAFSGVRSFGGAYNGGVELCAVIACLNSSLSSCGRRFPNYDDVYWPITFREITITADFVNDENRTQYPNSLLSSIRPINASQTVWAEEVVEVGGQSFVRRSFSVKEPQSRLLTFAIYGRNFGQDSPPDDDDGNGSVKSMGVSWFLMVVVVILSVVVAMK